MSRIIDRSPNSSLSTMNKCEKFQSRLINLSVTVDDQTKTIDLLIEAIKSHMETNDNEIKEENAKRRLQLKNAATKNNQGIAELLDIYGQKTKEKEEITCEIETLAEKQRQENEITKACLVKARKAIENDIKEASDEWKSCKSEREELWIAEKVKHVRACTVDALQPEIKRLSVSHEMEINKLIEEAAVRTKYLEKEIEMEFHRKFNQYLDEAERRKVLLLEGRAKTWRSKVHQIEEFNTKRLGEIKEKATHERNERNTPYNEEMVGSTNYQRQINDSNSQVKVKLREIEEIQNQKLDEINHNLEISLEKISNQLLKQKEEWELSEKVRLQNIMETEMKVIQTNIEKQRNADIDILIRSNYREDEGLETDLKKRKDRDRVLMNRNLTENIKHIKQNNESMKKNLAIVTQEVERLHIEQQNIQERLESKKQLIFRTETGLSLVQQACSRLVSTEINLNASIYEAIEDQDTKQSCLEKRLNELKSKFDSLHSDKRSQIECIKVKHNDKLKQMELKVLQDIKYMDRVLNESDNDMYQMKTKLDTQRAMLSSVYSSTRPSTDKPSIKASSKHKKIKWQIK